MPAGKAAAPKGRLLFWGFDKIYAVRLTAPARPGAPQTLMEGKLRNILSVSNQSSRLAVTGFPPDSKNLAAVVLHLPDMTIETAVGSDVRRSALGPEARELATASL